MNSVASQGSPPTEVLIVGGGIIGVACADELARRGVRVTVIDKGEIAHGCSYGNAGWLTPCFALPLAMPGMMLKSFKWMMDPEGPLYIKPRPSWDLVRWLLEFLGAANTRQMQASVAALVEISKFSLEAYRQLDAEAPGSFGFTQRGLLMAAQSPAGREAALQEMELVAAHGVPGRALDADQIRELEPALTGESVLGGVFFPEEAHCEPLATVRALAARAQRHGATFLPCTEVFSFERKNGQVTALNTTRGPMRADQYILATGAWSPPLARQLGLRVPVLSGKGYSLIVEPFEPAPTRPMMLIEKKVAVTPRDGSIRLAGTLELVGIDESITARRVEAIVRNARQYLSVPANPVVKEVWRGMRPCTPDGVPIIGRPSRVSNLLVAAGHQMLGMQTGTGTGRLAADLLTGSDPTFDPHPFRADRF